MKIELNTTMKKRYCFWIINKTIVCTSNGIAALFNLDTNVYNKLLIDKVIKHDNYFIEQQTNDLLFNLNNVSKDTYVERFKEAFADKLTLLTLGGI